MNRTKWKRFNNAFPELRQELLKMLHSEHEPDDE